MHGLTWDTSIKNFLHNCKKNFLLNYKKISHNYKKKFFTTIKKRHFKSIKCPVRYIKSKVKTIYEKLVKKEPKKLVMKYIMKKS